MALTYEWKLTALRKQNTDTLNNIVVGTQWKIIGTDSDGNTGIFNGATPFEAKDVNGDGFIDYQDLTEEIVLEWIKDYVSGVGPSNYMNHINEMIQKQIDEVKYSRIDVNENDLPWSPTSGSVTPEPTGERAPA
jgi:hypothetical protein